MLYRHHCLQALLLNGSLWEGRGSRQRRARERGAAGGGARERGERKGVRADGPEPLFSILL